MVGVGKLEGQQSICGSFIFRLCLSGDDGLWAPPFGSWTEHLVNPLPLWWFFWCWLDLGCHLNSGGTLNSQFFFLFIFEPSLSMIVEKHYGV